MPPKPPARLRDGRALTSLGLAAGLAVPVVVLGGPAAIAVPVTAPATPSAAVGLPDAGQPVCGDPDGEDFPIDTRIHGGPDTYASGGGYGTWYLDLTNTTTESCHSIHPVLVLTDEDRALTPEQIQLEFTERAHPDEEHRVTWESTDRDEQIGVFGSGEADDEFAGFTVPARKTVTVEVRMAFTSDTRPGRVTANAAIVQRRSAKDERRQAGGTPDGDWVGESADYPFDIVEGDIDGGTDTDSGTDSDTDTGSNDTTDSGTGTDRGTGTDSGTGTDTGSPRRDAAGNPLPELARTGERIAALAGLGAGALLLGGAAALIHARRLRRGHR